MGQSAAKKSVGVAGTVASAKTNSQDTPPMACKDQLMGRCTASGTGNKASNGKSAATSTGEEQSDPVARIMKCVEEARAAEQRRLENLQSAGDVLTCLGLDGATLTKLNTVNGRMIFVIDGALPNELRDDLFHCLQTDSFRRTEFARPDTKDYRHHVVEYNPEKLRNTKLFDIIQRLVEALFSAYSNSPLEVYRIYTNAVMYGDAAFVHRDANDDEHVTVLVYPNPEWKSELGGETIFYDEKGEIVEAIEPRPGRLCLFHGSIQHKGSPPSRLFWGSRYTTAFKFSPEDNHRPSIPMKGPPPPE